MRGSVNRQTGGRVADRPLRRDFLRSSVEADNLMLAFDVVVDVALAVRDRKLRLTGQRNRRHHFLRVRIYHGGVATASVEGPHCPGDRLVCDAIRIGAGGNAGHRLECPAIEDHDHIRAPVADVAVLSGCIQRNTVRALQPGDGADGFSAAGIDHFNPGTVRDVEAMGRGIRNEIVPAAIAADLPLRNEVIWALRNGGGSTANQRSDQ